MVRKKIGIDAYLDSSNVPKVNELELEIERLRSDNKKNSELEKLIIELRMQLSSVGGEHDVAIDRIFPNSDQPRRTFTEEDIKELALSFERHGQLEPVILIEQEDGNYLLFDGERRWRAASLIQKQSLRSVFMPALKSEDLHRKALVTTLFRQDLNVLDRAEAVLKEVEVQTDISLKDGEKLIRTCLYRLGNQKRTKFLTQNLGKREYDFSELDLSDTEIAVMTVLLDLNINPLSFVTADLAGLALSDDLKIAIRKSGLKIKQAFALNRLSASKLKVSESEAQKIRGNAIDRVLVDNLTEKETREYINTLLPQKSDSKITPLLVSLRNIGKEIGNPDLTQESLGAIQSELELLLTAVKEKIVEK
jgi:ParB family transcriptional regulator, chromosome partitioning protein